MYATVIWGRAFGGETGALIFLIIVLLVAAAACTALIKLSWKLRAVVGLVLLVGSVTLLPRSGCAAETAQSVEC